jgi:cytochrome c oxidase assembly factor CtaG
MLKEFSERIILPFRIMWSNKLILIVLFIVIIFGFILGLASK